jgi:hypothetical protein
LPKSEGTIEHYELSFKINNLHCSVFCIVLELYKNVQANTGEDKDTLIARHNGAKSFCRVNLATALE